MNDSAAGVSEREAQYLEHLRQAKALGVSLAEYCRSHGLNIKAYYQIARNLAERSRAPSGKKTRRAAAFAPVRITPVASAATMCRIKHPSGWVIECADLPSPSWLTALTASHP